MSGENDSLPQRGDIIAGKYQVEGILGTGGMGAVYKVVHRVTGKCFAVKWLLPSLSSETDAVKRFIREAQVAGRVDHPNVVEVYDVGQEGGSCYMVMQLLEGEPLAERMSRGKLSASEICRILIPVTRGLSAAHAAGIIHRDLKPENIFLCRSANGDEQPKVLDFGISKMSALATEVSSTITRQGVVMGTPHYMAPEQIRGLPVDGRTDVYALGVILYQALSATLPFPGESYSDLILKIMTETPVRLNLRAPETPRALIEVINKSLSREPADRFGGVVDLARALEPFADGMKFESGAAASFRPSKAYNGSASGSRTPLSTESALLRDSIPRSRLPKRLAWSVAIMAVVTLAAAGMFRTAREQRSHKMLAPPMAAVSAPKTSPPTAATAAASDPLPERLAPSADNANDELPVPNTAPTGPATAPGSAGPTWTQVHDAPGSQPKAAYILGSPEDPTRKPNAKSAAWRHQSRLETSQVPGSSKAREPHATQDSDPAPEPTRSPNVHFRTPPLSDKDF